MEIQLGLFEAILDLLFSELSLDARLK